MIRATNADAAHTKTVAVGIGASQIVPAAYSSADTLIATTMHPTTAAATNNR